MIVYIVIIDGGDLTYNKFTVLCGAKSVIHTGCQCYALALCEIKSLSCHKTALCIFHSVRLDPLESQVMQLLKNQDLSAAEVILCNENHISHLKDSTALMEALYNDEETDYNTLVTSARTSSSRIPVLSAIANLYLKQQIILQQI